MKAAAVPAKLIERFGRAALEMKAASDRGQRVLDGVQAEHVIVEAAKKQAEAIVEPARKEYLAALAALSDQLTKKR